MSLSQVSKASKLSAIKPNLRIPISPSTKHGRVTGAGKMQKTVQVQVSKRVWHRYLRKNYTVRQTVLVHDPNGSVNEGDVITMEPESHSQHVQFVVSSIVTAFGTPVSERPPIPNSAVRKAAYMEKHRAKLERRASRGILSAVQQLEALNITPPSQDQPTVGKGAELAEDGAVMEHGRKVLPQGLHKFGKINEEAQARKRATIENYEKATQEELRRRQVEQEDSEAKARESLEQKPGDPRA